MERTAFQTINSEFSAKSLEEMTNEEFDKKMVRGLAQAESGEGMQEEINSKL